MHVHCAFLESNTIDVDENDLLSNVPNHFIYALNVTRQIKEKFTKIEQDDSTARGCSWQAAKVVRSFILPRCVIIIGKKMCLILGL